MKRRSDQSQNEPVVEVTLQSIRGIVFRDGSPTNDHDDIDNDSLLLDMPNLTAAVAFTGSASEMEVASSFVCPHTGNLMVESLPAIYNNNNNNNNNDNDNSSSYTASPSRSTRMITQNGTTDNRSPSLTQSSSSSNNDIQQDMVVRWNECGDEALLNVDIPPHLTVRMNKPDPRLPRLPVSRTNRDSNIVQKRSTNEIHQNHLPALDESDASSECGEVGGSVPHDGTENNSTTDALHGNTSRHRPSNDDTPSETPVGSVMWSSSGAGMPEIVELNVSLKLDADYILRSSSKKKKKKNNKNRESNATMGRLLSKDDSHDYHDGHNYNDDRDGVADILDGSGVGGRSRRLRSRYEPSTIPTVFDIGVAYLVFFASDEGTTVMDLPVKKLQQPSSRLPEGCPIVVEDFASIRIKVDVYPNGRGNTIQTANTLGDNRPIEYGPQRQDGNGWYYSEALEATHEFYRQQHEQEEWLRRHGRRRKERPKNQSRRRREKNGTHPPVKSIASPHRKHYDDHGKQVMSPILQHLEEAEQMIGKARHVNALDHANNRPTLQHHHSHENRRVFCDLGMLDIVTTMSKALEYWETMGVHTQLFRAPSTDSSLDTASSLGI